MKDAKKFVLAAAISTALFEVLVSSPWWTGARHGGYDVLIRLAVPSLFLLMLAYYLLQKKYRGYSSALCVFIIVLQISILLTIEGAIRGLLP